MEPVALGEMETDLGIADAKVPVGTHICQIFSDDEERDVAMLKFLRMGLARGEKTACFSGNLSEQRLQDFVGQAGIGLAEMKAGKATVCPLRWDWPV